MTVNDVGDGYSLADYSRILEHFANEIYDLLCRLLSGRPLAGLFCRCEGARNMVYFNNKTL